MSNVQNFNGVLMIGDVVSTHKGGFVLLTKNLAINEIEYEDSHKVTVKGKMPDFVQPGAKVRVRAELQQIAKKTCIVAKADDLAPAAKDSEYMNLARLIGQIKHPFQYLGGIEGKSAIGNMLITVGKTAFRAVTFGAAAAGLQRVAKKGSVMKVEGRVQERAYTDRRTGKEGSMVEIVIDPDGTERLVAPEFNDPFAEAELGADPATAASPI